MRVLVVDDDEVHRTLAIEALAQDGIEATGAGSAEQALKLLEDGQQFDVIVTDYKMPGMTGIELLQRLGRPPSAPPVILVTGMGDEHIAAQAIKEGAQDYLAKDVPRLGYLTVLPASVREVARRNELLLENLRLKEEVRKLAGFDHIVAVSRPMQEILKLVQQVAPADSTVLISGESGTGKELIARAIHDQSPRRDGPFVATSCGAFPEGLIESELFGHEAGAFTGARSRHIGRFEKAHGGTLFLDEISEIPLKAQLDLLRVLQEHKFERVGGEQTIEVDVRIVAATNRDLEECVRAGKFRHDLYYRLVVIQIHIPPLRDRPDDIAPLAYHFLRRFAQRAGKPIEGFTPQALEALTEYKWPGNVRELENVVERAVVLTQHRLIDVADLPNSVRARRVEAVPQIDNLAAVEKATITRVLNETGWNLRESARRLGISRTTLYSKLRKHRIEPPEGRRPQSQSRRSIPHQR